MDEQNGGKVAPRPKKQQKQAKKNKQAQTQSQAKAQTPPPFPSVFAENFGYVDTTEAGNTIIKVLDQLQEAAQSAEGRARWEAWQLLETEVWSLRRGGVPLPIDLAAQPLLFVAARAVSAWIDSFAPVYLPDGQPQNENSGEVKL